MPGSEKKPSLSLGLIGVVAVVATGAGAAWWAYNSFQTATTPPASVDSFPQEKPTIEQPSAEQNVQVYWLDASGNSVKLMPSSIAVEKSAQPQEALEAAFEHLLAGTSEQNYATTIPEGTELLGLSVEPDGVHVNLSEEFTTGGGSTSMMGRIGQVIYTATGTDANSPVWINIEGEPLKVLGGEGILVEQPMTRQIFTEDFPY